MSDSFPDLEHQCHTRINQETLDALLEQLLEFALLIPTFEEDVSPVFRDPKDDYLITLAVLNAADYIVTRDKDLLDLNEVVGVRIVEPVGFLALLRATRE